MNLVRTSRTYYVLQEQAGVESRTFPFFRLKSQHQINKHLSCDWWSLDVVIMLSGCLERTCQLRTNHIDRKMSDLEESDVTLREGFERCVDDGMLLLTTSDVNTLPQEVDDVRPETLTTKNKANMCNNKYNV